VSNRTISAALQGTSLPYTAHHCSRRFPPRHGCSSRALETTGRRRRRILRELYAELPQPEGDLTLADCYRAANDLVHARNPTSASTINTHWRRRHARRSRSAGPQRYHGRRVSAAASSPDVAPPDRLMSFARTLSRAPSIGRCRSSCRLGARPGARAHRRSRFSQSSVKVACSYFRGLDLAPSEADAERLYDVGECARRQATMPR